MLPAELSQKYSVYIRSFVTLLTRHYQVRAEAGLRKTFTIPPITGLGAAFFCILNASFFCVLLKNATWFCILFSSFWRLMRPQKNNAFFCVLFLRTQRMQRSFAKKERIRTQRTQRTQRSFAKNAKERKRMHVLLKRMQKNIRERAFFYKERKRMQRTQGSFIKNIKECKEHNVLL